MKHYLLIVIAQKSLHISKEKILQIVFIIMILVFSIYWNPGWSSLLWLVNKHLLKQTKPGYCEIDIIIFCVLSIIISQEVVH